MTEEYKPFDVNSLFGDSSAPAPASPEDVLPHPVAGNESEERLVPTLPEPLASLPPTAPVTKAALALPSAITSDDEGDDVFTPAPKTNPVVEALQGAGLYIEALGEGRHSLTCPWRQNTPQELKVRRPIQCRTPPILSVSSAALTAMPKAGAQQV